MSAATDDLGTTGAVTERGTDALARFAHCAGCDSRGSLLCAIALLTDVRRKCAGRELNPGYELGKLMSYH